MPRGNTQVRFAKEGFPFNPAEACYYLRYITGGTRRPDGSKYPPVGPYWYAYWQDKRGMHATYLGKELPPECAEFKDNAPSVSYPVPALESTSNYHDAMKAAIDRGSQVIIDIDSIALSCGAYADQITPRRFVLYRDPKNE